MSLVKGSDVSGHTLTLGEEGVILLDDVPIPIRLKPEFIYIGYDYKISYAAWKRLKEIVNR